jgi:hypothetical protein
MSPASRRPETALLLLALLAAPLAGAIVATDPPAGADAFAPALAATSAGAAATWLEPAAEGATAVRFARFENGAWSAPATVVAAKALFSNWADTPGVAVAGDGALLVWWLERIGGETYAYGIRVARSTDGGAIWLPLGWLQDDLSASEHGFVSIVAEGRGARAFWLDGRATGGGHEGHGGEPGGGAMTLRTTTIGERIEMPSTLVDDAVCDCCGTSAIAGAGGPLVAYRDRSREEIRDIYVARGIGTGAIASTPVGADRWKIAGCPVNGPTMVRTGVRIATVWFTGAEDRARVQVAFSADGGASFAPAREIDGAGPLGRVGAAPLAGGEIALSWLGRAGERAEVRMRRVSAGGEARRPLVIGATAAGRRSGFPRLATLPDGELLVLWVEAGEGGSRVRGHRLAPADLPN